MVIFTENAIKTVNQQLTNHQQTNKPTPPLHLGSFKQNGKSQIRSSLFSPTNFYFAIEKYKPEQIKYFLVLQKLEKYTNVTNNKTL